jgi:hypothetical protein
MLAAFGDVHVEKEDAERVLNPVYQRLDSLTLVEVAKAAKSCP